MPARKRALTPTFSSDPISPGHEWSTPKRAKVIALDREGCSRKEIRKATHVPERTQTTIINQPTRRLGKERSGRPPLIDQETVQKMIKALQGRYNERKKPWDLIAEEFTSSEFGPPLSARTVRRYINSAGYYKCRACQKSWISEEQARNRLHWCERHKWPK